ncbi:MAG: glycosyltransferase family 9 protein, partial [Desulfomonilaceae bacterium]
SRSRVVIGIDPISSQPLRSWPLEHFARLSDLLSKELRAEILFCRGSADGAETISRIWDQAHERDFVKIMNNAKDPKGLPEALEKLDLFISVLNESSYLAAAIGVPTLVIWPGQVAPQESSPIGSRVMSVRMATTCSPCRKANPQECPYDVKCLKMLWPYKVFEASRKILGVF